ncbi:ATP-binding cassette domain-containing protein [Allosaccharopolyspora coralli]|uniref:ATP-binding cassette domain-containing protein n=1 Tax=Allosaccharopolyspora coralli TaxID=2665642 RepID=A0A5Q3QBD8_9PSEU|nr:ABC transporter ATP-binding protein [Allosaccharopolyspora coralli]QGK71782.1 ATP-binding cassette domain-containing protein [Allosaccharopolyspora coralli]
MTTEARSSSPHEAVDSRSPSRYLWSVLRQRPRLLTLAAVAGAVNMIAAAVLPLVIGRAVDTGIAAGATAVLLGWVAVVLVLGLLQAAGMGALEWAEHTLWLHGTSTTQRVVARHITGLGFALSREVRTGEAVAISSTDSYRIGNLYENLGRLIGSVLAFLVAAVIVLSMSPTLGLVVLVGVPLAVAGIGPLLPVLQRREEVQRERISELNAQAGDIATGLRILRGIGGEHRFHARFTASSRRAREAGIAAGRVEAWLAASEILLPGLVTVAVTWLGARLALAGTITVGELIAFYGISAFLVIPVRTATEALDALSQALVAAGRVTSVLALRPAPPAPERPRPLPPGPLGLHDPATGLTARAGVLTVIDAGNRIDALAQRLAHHAESDMPVTAAGPADPAVPLNAVEPDELRRRVVLAHNEDVLFTGYYRDALDLGSTVDLGAALHAADADDAVDALDGGVIDERGRSLSGGQRQRLVLARALTTDADVLVLDEPTSAVDAHTESRIVERVRALRAGRTTVVLTQSPLWKAAADETHTVEGSPA